MGTTSFIVGPNLLGVAGFGGGGGGAGGSSGNPLYAKSLKDKPWKVRYLINYGIYVASILPVFFAPTFSHASAHLLFK